MGAPFTICLALVALGAAVGAELKAREHLGQGDWQLARARAHAESYVQTFDGQHVDAQLASFAERRAALAQATRWEQGRSVAVVAAALLLLLAWLQAFLSYLESLRLDRTESSGREQAAPLAPQPAGH